MAIQQVGVTDLRHPIVVLDRSAQSMMATFALSISPPHHAKGTHMSRFIEVLDRPRGQITVRTLARRWPPCVPPWTPHAPASRSASHTSWIAPHL